MPTQSSLPQSSILRAIGWVLFGCLCFALMSASIRQLSGELPVMVTLMFRNIIGSLILLPWLWRWREAFRHSRHKKLHFARATLSWASMMCWFTSVSILPLDDAIALSYTTPLFMAVMAVMFLKEPWSRRRSFALLAGFAGAMLVIRPEIFSLPSLDTATTSGRIGLLAIIPLTASVFASLSMIIVRPLSKRESSHAMFLYFSFFMLPLSLPLGLINWQAWPSHTDWLWLILLSVASLLTQWSVIRAYSLAEVTKLLPFDFFRLLATAWLAWWWFDESLDAFSAIGAAVILLAAILSSPKPSRSSQKTEMPTTYSV